MKASAPAHNPPMRNIMHMCSECMVTTAKRLVSHGAEDCAACSGCSLKHPTVTVVMRQHAVYAAVTRHAKVAAGSPGQVQGTLVDMGRTQPLLELRTNSCSVQPALQRQSVWSAVA
jgi:hypothetical protein